MKPFRVSILFLIVVMTISCAVNPVTGKKELMFYSEEGEIALGQQVDNQIRAQYGTYDDPRLNQYIEELGQQIAAESHRPNLKYHFAILDTPVVNAFAAPGGYIYLTRGVLALMNSEAELAAVIGHELGHVNARHSVKRMSGQILLNLGLVIGSALSEDVAKWAGVAGVGMQLLFLKFSRSDEYQADSLGIEYSRKVGYPPGKMVDFFNSIQSWSGMYSGGHQLPNFLSTHPLTGNRIKRVQEQVMETDRQLPARRNAYMNKINRLVYGDNPRQGFKQGNRFYHPQLSFSFAIPGGWLIQNSPKQVVLASPDKQATVILQVEPNQNGIVQYSQKKASSLQGATLISSRRLNVNGFQSVNSLYSIPQEQQDPVNLQFTCIQKGKYAYSFYSVSASATYGNYSPSFNSVVNSFSVIRNRKILNARPRRIVLVRTSGSATLKQILVREKVPQKQWKHVSVLNLMDLDSRPARNTVVKIVR